MKIRSVIAGAMVTGALVVTAGPAMANHEVQDPRDCVDASSRDDPRDRLDVSTRDDPRDYVDVSTRDPHCP
jgi:hypothetical protein